MKKLSFLLLALIGLSFSAIASASFCAVNSDGDTIYYNITSSSSPYTVEVTNSNGGGDYSSI